MEMAGDLTDDFLRLLTASQRPLYAFIRAHVRTRTDADEILQQTTTVLWQKFATFDRNGDFIRWACGVAWREVLAHRRNDRRQLLLLGEELGTVLAAKISAAAVQIDRRLDKLHECMSVLKPDSQKLIQRHYHRQESIGRIAASKRLTESSVYKTLAKIRQILLACIERKLKEEV